MANRSLKQLVGKGFMACPGSFPSSRGEKHPDPMSLWEADPGKNWDSLHPVMEINPIRIFLHVFFSEFLFPIPNSANQPQSGRVGCRVGSSGTGPLDL